MPTWAKLASQLGPQIQPKSVDPSAVVIRASPGEDLPSPLPLSLLGAFPAGCRKTRENPHKSQKHAFRSCFFRPFQAPWGLSWAFVGKPCPLIVVKRWTVQRFGPDKCQGLAIWRRQGPGSSDLAPKSARVPRFGPEKDEGSRIWPRKGPWVEDLAPKKDRV